MSDGARPRVVVFGDVIDDIVVQPHLEPLVDTDTQSSIRQVPGGAAANVSAWLGSTGVAVDFIGRVGAIDCDYHAAFLADFGVRAHLTPDATRPTGTIIVIVDENEGRTVLIERGANRVLTPNDVPDSLLDGAAALYFPQHLLGRCRERGVPVVVDPGSGGQLAEFGVAHFLRAVAGASVLLPNLPEGRALTGLDDPFDVATRLAESFGLVALTMGAEGAVVVVDGQPPVMVPAAGGDRTDASGAGDAFGAGFVAAWLEGASMTSAADAGSRLAARAIAIVGGRPV
ncbi:PfkB family carbohydrate kinase [Cryobacterium sp. PH31-L1]|uniref:carbohydrate kinase family protein n=1 Tax=Cryobacterium sp. PH31-L1 TaxID=3046199 RepID=UPI0024BB619F|nr:PfkB family carbohydrate kinase [Cryobacterium sp. PH31-L1]MDJ0376360.1 PfkB family carbohydrate kinase [Cryobacterium sp. PH31-L1]